MGDDWEDNSASLSMGDSSKKKGQKVSLVQEMKARRGDQVRQGHSQKFLVIWNFRSFCFIEQRHRFEQEKTLYVFFFVC